jgi:hypothetical protein
MGLFDRDRAAETEPSSGASTTAATGDALDESARATSGPVDEPPAPASQPPSQPAVELESAAARPGTADLVERGERADAARESAAEPADRAQPLLVDADSYSSRWQTIQAGFVDEPRRAVQEADALVAEVMRRLAEGFATERERLEHQWSGGKEVDTEDLRLALRRYRSFFDRLLST